MKAKKIIGWVLTGLLSALFVFSGIGKIMGAPEVADGFNKMGLGDKMALIGAMEIAIVLLILIPRTGVLGTVLMTGYVGGIILAHLMGGMSIGLPIAFGVLFCVAGYLRFPELGARLFGTKE